jgi:hypothetical protein
LPLPTSVPLMPSLTTPAIYSSTDRSGMFHPVTSLGFRGVSKGFPSRGSVAVTGFRPS